MPKCIYCNREIGDGPAFSLESNAGICCSEHCKEQAAHYLNREAKYKHWYALLCIVALIFWGISFFFGIAPYVGGIAMILCGTLCILFPFAVKFLSDFLGIKNSQKVSVYVGALVVVIGILYVIE